MCCLHYNSIEKVDRHFLRFLFALTYSEREVSWSTFIRGNILFSNSSLRTSLLFSKSVSAWSYKNAHIVNCIFLQVWVTVANQNKIVNTSGPLHHRNAMMPARAKSLCKRSLQGSLTRRRFVSSKLFLSLSVSSWIIQKKKVAKCHRKIILIFNI